MNRSIEQSIKKLTLENGTIIGITGRDNGNYSSIEETLAIICSEILGIDNVDISQNLIVLGADSLSLLEIIQEISDQFHIEVEPDELSSNVTVMKIAELIEEKTIND